MEDRLFVEGLRGETQFFHQVDREAVDWIYFLVVLVLVRFVKEPLEKDGEGRKEGRKAKQVNEECGKVKEGRKEGQKRRNARKEGRKAGCRGKEVNEGMREGEGIKEGQKGRNVRKEGRKARMAGKEVKEGS